MKIYKNQIKVLVFLLFGITNIANSQSINKYEIEKIILNDIHKKYNCGNESCMIRKKQINYDSAFINSFWYDSIFTINEVKFRIDSNIYFYQKMPFDTSFIKGEKYKQFKLLDDDIIQGRYFTKGNNTFKHSNLLFINENLYVYVVVHAYSFSSYRGQSIFYKFKKDNLTLKWKLDAEAIRFGCD